MKKILILVSAFLVCNIANAQLVIYSGYNQQGSSATCVVRTIYVGASIPNSLNNVIKSITLSQGYMAVLAENEDGSGEGFNYIASVSNISVNLATVLQNKVSFIRVLPITNVKKKGTGLQDVGNLISTNLNSGWLYDWGAGDVSVTNREYVPMSWGRGGASDANVNAYIAKTDITGLLAFNEPDNADQSNIPYADAVPLYKKLLRTGYRMGSPATTESEYRLWLKDFTDLAEQDNLRIDFVAVHWYDWGNWLSGLDPNASATGVFNRFKSYIAAVYTLYGKPIWITEFNANRNRVSAVHEAFMALALPWLETDARVERYAYFFPPTVPPSVSGVLTAAGTVYGNHVSTSAYPANVTDTRPAAILPVTLSDFQSIRIKNDVFLKWETKSEVNFSCFVLERSTDAKTFLDIAKINAAKMSNGSTYSYTDTPEAAATNYYRLKMVDTDGSFVYSKIISQGYAASNTPLLVYPSIATQNKIEVAFKKVSDEAQIRIYSMTGQLISTRHLQAGTSTETIDLATFTEGSYFLVLEDNGTIQSRKFIKQ